MHWLYVIRVDADALYSGEKLAKGQSPEFDKMWFDERTLTPKGRAYREKGWDRLGSIPVREVEGLLYLGDLAVPSEVLEP